MMILLIALAILFGWLVTELKEFISGGGFANILAFSLLKICLILFIIVILIMTITFYDLIVRLVQRIKHQNHHNNIEERQIDNEKMKTPQRRNSN